MSHLLPLCQADWIVSPDWVAKFYEPDITSEMLLHRAHFHAAPAVKMQ